MTSASQYASVLAKIGVERSKFLSETKIKGLSESKNIQEVATQLRDSDYQGQVARIVPPITGLKMERAFNENFIESLLMIIKNSPKKAGDFLKLYLLSYEVGHLKAILKSINGKLSPEERLSKIYFQVEDYFGRHMLIEEAAKAPTLTHFVYLFKGSEYYSPLNLALKVHEETGATAPFDIYLDRYYYEKLCERFQNLSSKAKEYAKFYAAMDNDTFTLLTVLRGKILNVDPNRLRIIIPQKYFLLQKSDVESLVSAVDFESALKVTLQTPFGKYFSKTQDPYETVAKAEKIINQEVLDYAKKSRILESFSIGLPLGFLTMKRAEIHNLVAASLGVEAGMKPEALCNLLLI